MGRLSPLFLLLAVIALAAARGQSPPATSPGSAGSPQSPPGSASGGSSAATSGGGGLMPGVGADVAVIPVHGEIDDFALTRMKREVGRALRGGGGSGGASVIVFEMNTNGGVVTSALDMAKYIHSLPVPTIAWIHDKAYSAGILVSSSCDQIIMSPNAATGDCAPIVPGKNLAPTERAKALSPVLGQFHDNAAQGGYPYALFHAMCVLGVEVYEIKNPKTGQHRLVNQVDEAVMVQGADPAQFPPAPAASAPGNAPGSSSKGSSGNPFSGSGNGSASNGVTAAQVGAATLRVAGPGDRGKWKRVRRVHDGKTLLTLSAKQAGQVGLSRATVANTAQLKKYLGAASITRVGPTWSETLAQFLLNNVVRGVLVVALLIGIYVELHSPGLGLGGAVAAGAAFLLLGVPLIMGLAEVWVVLMFLLGLGLLIIELLATPTFGLLGIAGVGMMFAGLVLSAVPSGAGGLPAVGTGARLMGSLVSTTVALGISCVGFYFLTKYFGRLPLLGRLILDDPRAAAAGGGDLSGHGSRATPVSGHEVIGAGRIRVGDTGRVTATGLHPTGRAHIDGHAVDVIGPGGYVNPDTPIRVVEVRGNRIVVDTEEHLG